MYVYKQKEKKMNTKNLVTRTVIIFVALAIAGISVAVGAKFMLDAFEQTIMIAIGSAMFGAALTFFLIRLFALVEK
jgi:hypothetical protein